MISDPLVQVLLVTYNQGPHLQKAIDSVLAQTYTNWRLLIMDDGSTDRTAAVLCGLDGYEDPRVEVLQHHPTVEDRQLSVRYATLFNNGVARTDSDYVTFLCGDDYYMPDRLERMVKATQFCDVVYGAQRMAWPGTERADEIRPTQGVLSNAYHLVDLNSVMVSRNAFEQVDGFPTEPTTQNWREADALLWCRLTTAGYYFYPVPGGPTDCKVYRNNSVDARLTRGETPW